MKNCKNCRFFKPSDNGFPYEEWGDCTKITDGQGWPRPKTAPQGVLAEAWDHEGYAAGLYVGPDFGCVQFEES